MSEACCGPAVSESPRAMLSEPAPRLRDLRAIRLGAGAGLFLAIGLSLSAADASSTARLPYAVAIILGGLTFFPGAIRGLVDKRLGVDTLMAIAATGAVVLGEWGEAATLAFLFSLSEALEGYALTRTRRGLRALLDLAPTQATILRGGNTEVVELVALEVGDLLLVRPGERVASDGVLRAGRSALDLSAITGESLPVEHGPGDAVAAAAINGGGVLEVEVTARAEDNSLAKIVRIVEEAQDRKGQAQRLAERIAAPLVPGVLVVAFLIAVVGSLAGDPGTWVERALVVLVAAAPCAFAISVPVTVVAAIGAATRSGVLIKGGAALEALSRVDIVALDKTGTLTRNRPEVTEVIGEDALRVAAALERRSEHPLAAAILAAAEPGPGAEAVEAVPGSGLTGVLEGAMVRLGRPGFIPAGPLAEDVLRLQQAGATVVLVERDDELLGAIAVRDELRAEARSAVARLHETGRRTAMLTGDNRATAEAVAAEAGISDVHAELLPTDKLDVVERLRTDRATAMVGDGINDAPALASADIGIAMGAMGTDVAIEAADVALMGDDLRVLPDAIDHAHAAGRIMKQNLLLSGAILVTLVPLAATGVLGLASVVATHELAELLVILNGVRAGRRSAFRVHAALPDAAPRVATRAPAPPVLAPAFLPIVMVGGAGNSSDDAGCQDDCCS